MPSPYLKVDPVSITQEDILTGTCLIIQATVDDIDLDFPEPTDTDYPLHVMCCNQSLSDHSIIINDDTLAVGEKKMYCWDCDDWI